MVFNHYAKLKRIIDEQPAGWYIQRIDEPTTATSFKGERRQFDHYYRLFDARDQPIKYGKFQQLERLANILGVSVDELPVVS